MRYILYFSRIDPEGTTDWMCPVCLRPSVLTHGPKPHEDFEQVMCVKCETVFKSVSNLRPHGRKPKRAEGRYESDREPMCRARPIDGTKYEVLITAFMDREVWECPRCGTTHQIEDYRVRGATFWAIPGSFKCEACGSQFRTEKDCPNGFAIPSDQLPLTHVTHYEAKGGMTICEILDINRDEDPA